MRTWTAEQIATAAQARLLASTSAAGGPQRAVIDSREAGHDTLFVGLRGAQLDGGLFAAQALAAGAWGVLATPEHAHAALGAGPGAVLCAEQPLQALQLLAGAWRQQLAARVIGVTGSTGKTSTKDLLEAVLAPQRATIASRANFNTEIGLPLEILRAPVGTEVLVLEMAMRGRGQIAELTAIARPDVGVIVSIGPVHLELLGTIEAVAAAKAELIAGLEPGATVVVPVDEPLLGAHLRGDLRTLTFGAGADVALADAGPEHVEIDLLGEPIRLEVPFPQAHLRRNLLAAAAAAHAVGVTPRGRVELELRAGRGRRLGLPGDITLIDDCYNANPMSMCAALDDLAAIAGAAPHRRRVAVLGDMLELGPAARDFHAQLGSYAGAAGVDLLVAVGPLAASIAQSFEGESHTVGDAGEAAALVPQLLAPGDAVLVKASRGVGLELVCRALEPDGARA